MHTCRKRVFITGFAIGLVLAFLFLRTENFSSRKRAFCQHKQKFLSYTDWFTKRATRRQPLDEDAFIYGKKIYITEADFLKNEVSVLCVVFVHKVKNVNAIKNTWGKHCNDIVFFSSVDHASIHVNHLKPRNAFHYLCDSVHFIMGKYQKKIQWVLFAPDDLFVISENVRFYVASLDYNVPYYLGHALTFWGQIYNAAEAGYILSKGALQSLISKFNTTESCLKGGKYWKNEDFYLGRHLAEMGIVPKDTRDGQGCGRFHSSNFQQLLDPGGFSKLTNYLKKSAYPASEGPECCSDHSITFQGIEADKFYFYEYLLNHVRVFRKPSVYGSKPAPTDFPEEQVWLDFLKEEGKENTTVSADEYYRLWKKRIIHETRFKENAAIATSMGFINMPDVLESMLSAVRANDSEHGPN